MNRLQAPDSSNDADCMDTFLAVNPKFTRIGTSQSCSCFKNSVVISQRDLYSEAPLTLESDKTKANRFQQR